MLVHSGFVSEIDGTRDVVLYDFVTYIYITNRRCITSQNPLIYHSFGTICDVHIDWIGNLELRLGPGTPA